MVTLVPIRAVRDAVSAGVVDPIVYQAPFLTDADMRIYLNDTNGIVCHEETGTRSNIFYYPNITNVLVEGTPLPVLGRWKDRIAVSLPEGEVEVTIQTVGSGPTNEYPASSPIDTPGEFNTAAASLSPGDELVVRNGYYRNFEVTVPVGVDGTAANPILIRPESPGGVMLGYHSRVYIYSSHVIFKGFRFEHCLTWSFRLLGVDHTRITQCQFLHCGNPATTGGHILNISETSNSNRIDHCLFTGSKSMSLGQSIPIGNVDTGQRNRMDYNIFRDIYRYCENGQENIQLGWGQVGTVLDTPHTLVEYNLFDNAWGDCETISVKCSENTVRYNVSANSRAALVFRGGNSNVLEGNVVFNCKHGIRAHDGGHTIINNLFVNASRTAIELAEGDFSRANILVANNTVINGGRDCINVTAGSAAQRTNNCFINNLFVSEDESLVDADFLNNQTDPVLDNNLFWAIGSCTYGPTGTHAIVADPLLEGSGIDIRPATNSPAVDAGTNLAEVAIDRWGGVRPHGALPDIGADEVGADLDGVVLPDLPAERTFSYDDFKDSIVWLYNPSTPTFGWSTQGNVSVADTVIEMTNGAGLTLDRTLPTNCVIEWEFQADDYRALSAVVLSENSGEGYILECGGSAFSNKPGGILYLKRGSDGIVAEGADLQYHSRFYGETNSAPDPAKWYQFRLLKFNGRFRMEMNNEYLSGEFIPMLMWQDTGALGPILNGPTLRFEQAGTGTGRYRNINIWGYGTPSNEEHTISISSAHGSPDPPEGFYTNVWGTVLSNSVTSPEPHGTTQHVCTGWTMTGNEPVAGTETNMTMTVTNNAQLTWTWKTQYWLGTYSGPNGSVTPPDGWYDDGSNVTVTATPYEHYEFRQWTGNGTNAITVGAVTDATVSVTMSGPAALNANFDPVYPANTTNAIPYSESFESYPSGFELAWTNGWYCSKWDALVVRTNADAIAGLADYSGKWGYPLNTNHAKVAEVSSSITNMLSGPTNQVIWVDQMLKVSYRTIPDAPAADPDGHVMFYVNTNGHLVILHSDLGSGSNVWTELSHDSVAEGGWVRITVQADYETEDDVHLVRYFQIRLDGKLLLHPSGYTKNDGSGRGGGGWFPMSADSLPQKLSRLIFSGGGCHIEDLVVTTNAPPFVKEAMTRGTIVIFDW